MYSILFYYLILSHPSERQHTENFNMKLFLLIALFVANAVGEYLIDLRIISYTRDSEIGLSGHREESLKFYALRSIFDEIRIYLPFGDI